jgi:hypothetical protein
MSFEKAKKIKDRYKEYLMSLENVVSIGIGLKKVKGKVTEELSIIVGVSTKKPFNLLKKSDIIPSELDGIKTDVIQVGEISAL